MAAKPLTATFLAQLRGGDAGDRDVVATWAISAPNETTQTLLLAQNAFTFLSVPAGTTLILIIPPTNNTQTVTLKGQNADTGIALSKTRPSLVAIDPSATIGIALGAGSNQTFKIVYL